jgi:hypothetical protein
LDFILDYLKSDSPDVNVGQNLNEIENPTTTQLTESTGQVVSKMDVESITKTDTSIPDADQKTPTSNSNLYINIFIGLACVVVIGVVVYN